MIRLKVLVFTAPKWVTKSCSGARRTTEKKEAHWTATEFNDWATKVMSVVCFVCLIKGAGPKFWSSAQLKSVAQMQGKEVQEVGNKVSSEVGGEPSEKKEASSEHRACTLADNSLF